MSRSIIYFPPHPHPAPIWTSVASRRWGRREGYNGHGGREGLLKGWEQVSRTSPPRLSYNALVPTCPGQDIGVFCRIDIDGLSCLRC